MKHTFPILLGLAACAGAASAQLSAYTPSKGQVQLSPAYVYSYYDDAWIGRTSMPIEQDQHSAFLTIEFGLTERIAFDATVGYSWAEIDGSEDDGLTDTTIGIRGVLLDEAAGAPFQAALRVGAVIPGTYDEGLPFSVGDGAAGVETSLLLGKAFCQNFGVYGDFGYRWRDNDVPQELFGSGGFYVTGGGFTFAAGYRGFWGTEGGDIMGPGFGVTYGFPQTKEVQHNIEASLSYTDAGDRTYQVFYSRTLDGRNTGEHNVFGVAITLPFGGSEPAPAPAPVGKNPAPTK